ncbi:hypothetical protein AQUCO_00100485v1 [Aquilegia coerulea]|uniref:HSF-type DNA-binding domain-containing protein n=1 Tax=Aquilegia coerulea TaxID=218851 RepID=A0A2G5FAJ4_AQUCA|nr:hypothetical protein AQUCO_00100485v1 [Aquilegia coerulea]
MEVSNTVAPFVLKTYQMVDDPSTNLYIRWGSGNNSFLLLNPLEFADRLLPIYFKHNNFSSFVRQLNTYGFKKVDPDKWEFAHESFLRGQIQLLQNIVRKKYNNRSAYFVQPKQELPYEDDEEDVSNEVMRLKQEQQELEEELEGMNKRLQATQRRPQQMMAFLIKVVEDPEILSKMTVEKENETMFGEKKRRLMISATSSSSLETMGQTLILPEVPLDTTTGTSRAGQPFMFKLPLKHTVMGFFHSFGTGRHQKQRKTISRTTNCSYWKMVVTGIG